VVHEREARVAQRVEPRADREPRDHVERGQPLRRDPELGLADRTRPRAASRITSSGSVIVWNEPLPSSLFTTRVMCLSSIAFRKRAGTTSMSSSPPQDAPHVGVVEHRGVPGNPSAAPVITTAAPPSPRAEALLRHRRPLSFGRRGARRARLCGRRDSRLRAARTLPPPQPAAPAAPRRSPAA
jgi:hypothetical protein